MHQRLTWLPCEGRQHPLQPHRRRPEASVALPSRCRVPTITAASMDEPASINIQGSNVLDARKDGDGVQHHPQVHTVVPVSCSPFQDLRSPDGLTSMALDVSGPSRNAQSVGSASSGHQRRSSKEQYCVEKRKCTCDLEVVGLAKPAHESVINSQHWQAFQAVCISQVVPTVSTRYRPVVPQETASHHSFRLPLLSTAISAPASEGSNLRVNLSAVGLWSLFPENHMG